jgi:sugar/nucleoside kinase (ribokinase family)
MSWTERTDTTVVEEWRREDGWATIRLRRRGEGSWLVRLDRLTQAPEGSLYREERLDTRSAADALVAEWRETYDVSETDDEQ